MFSVTRLGVIVCFLDDGRMGCYNSGDIVGEKQVDKIVDVKWDKDMYKAVSSNDNVVTFMLAGYSKNNYAYSDKFPLVSYHMTVLSCMQVLMKMRVKKRRDY